MYKKNNKKHCKLKFKLLIYKVNKNIFLIMINRNIKNTLIETLEIFPVVCLLGARQVGKTTLAKILKKQFSNSIYLDLELDTDLAKLEVAEFFLSQYYDKLVIIDEIQRKPELFVLMRALIDKNRKPARFLILGSASGDLLKQSSESLAGRIAYFELSPFCLGEIELKNFQKLWSRGGYPESFLAKNDKLSLLWRKNMIKTYLERDLPQLNINITSLRLKKLLQMIAHNHGHLLNISLLSKNLDVSTTTVANYLDILESTFLIRRIRPYWSNMKKRLIKSPKIYIRDSGLLHALLEITDLDNLHGSLVLGNSWEGFVIEQLLALNPNQDYCFFRTAAGAEIDLIFLKAGQANIAIEIKYSAKIKLSPGFFNAMTDMKIKKAYIIYPGKESYFLQENIKVISIYDVFKEPLINS